MAESTKRHSSSARWHWLPVGPDIECFYGYDAKHHSVLVGMSNKKTIYITEKELREHYQDGRRHLERVKNYGPPQRHNQNLVPMVGAITRSQRERMVSLYVYFYDLFV